MSGCSGRIPASALSLKEPKDQLRPVDRPTTKVAIALDAVHEDVPVELVRDLVRALPRDHVGREREAPRPGE
eukprot:2755385-Alexandrium_andersonii.AAC.1